MCLTRIYCQRRKDLKLFRFRSKAALVAYSKANGETRKTLPIIERSTFITERNRLYESPQWVDSVQFAGMSFMREG